MSETEERRPPRAATPATPARIQWGDYSARPMGVPDSTGRVRWRVVGPGVGATTWYLSRDEARTQIAARLRAWGLEEPEVEVAWAEMPSACASVEAVGEGLVSLPAWAVVDRSKRLPACIVVGCGTHRYQRGLCWEHFGASARLGIKEHIALPPVRGSRGGR